MIGLIDYHYEYLYVLNNVDSTIAIYHHVNILLSKTNSFLLFSVFSVFSSYDRKHSLLYFVRALFLINSMNREKKGREEKKEKEKSRAFDTLCLFIYLFILYFIPFFFLFFHS